MALLPDKMERQVNDVLHLDGVEYSTEEITNLIPVSKRKKKHAKTSNWSKSDEFNLGFTVKSRGGAANKKGSFGYLIFPDEGRGSKNPIAHKFMEKGLDKSIPRVLEKMHVSIDRLIEEEL